MILSGIVNVESFYNIVREHIVKISTKISFSLFLSCILFCGCREDISIYSGTPIIEETECNGIFVDLNSHSLHCGSCNHACVPGEDCQSGKCVFTGCPEDYMECDGVCVQYKTDTQNCGSCHHVCEAEAICSQGICVKMEDCPEGHTYCNGLCYDFSINHANCGSCGHACLSDEICAEGKCTKVCPEGYENCNGNCVILDLNAQNCGACGNVCDPGKICKNRECISTVLHCEGDNIPCDDHCVDIQMDPLNCGGCGQVCQNGELCRDGKCSSIEPECESPFVMCNGGCADFQTDPRNCGTCGQACQNNETCKNGKCTSEQPDCLEPMLLCDGKCTDPKSDAQNCGFCGHICSNFEYCSEGECLEGEESCKEPLVLCNGKCVDVQSDVLNCGECHHDCLRSEVCEAGFCRKRKCEIYETMCDGQCVDLLHDDNNCYVCGNVCELYPNAIHTGCLEGSCGYNCLPDYANCDLDNDNPCNTLITTDDNCGACGNKCPDGYHCSPSQQCYPTECTEDGGQYATIHINSEANFSAGYDIKAFCIKDKDTLLAVRDAINSNRKYPEDNLNADYILMADIDLGTQDNWKGIGDTYHFGGHFLGNDHTIKGNLNCQTNYCGLFAYVDDGKLDSLHLELDVTNSADYTGSLAGFFSGHAYMISEKGNIKGRDNTGGLMGDGDRCGSCFYSGKISGGSHVGGIAGASHTFQIGLLNESDYYLSQVRDAVIEGSQYVGGFVGKGGNNTYLNENSISNVTIHNEGNYTGGYMGYMDVNSFASYNTVENCTIEGHDYTGGFVGYANSFIEQNAWQNRINFFSLNNSTIRSNMITGGIVGYGSDIYVYKCDAKADINVLAGYAGGIIGHAERAFFERITANGTIKTTGLLSEDGQKIGGFAGLFYQSQAFAVKSSVGISSAFNYIGGMVGEMDSSKMDDCVSFGKMDGNEQVGGFAGAIQLSVLDRCRSTGNVKATSSFAGGFGGSISSSNITNSYASGSVAGSDNLGGFAGRMTYSTIDNVAAYGEVHASDDRAGGLIGYSFSTANAGQGNEIARSAAFGNVSGKHYVGGLVGYISGDNQIDNSFSTGNVHAIEGFSGGFFGYFDDNSYYSTTVDSCYMTGKIIDTESITYHGSLVGNQMTNMTFENTYYWEHSDKIVSPDLQTGNEKVFPFAYKDRQASRNATPLHQLLNKTQDNWIILNCYMKSGPGSDHYDYYIIPGLKNVDYLNCRQAE